MVVIGVLSILTMSAYDQYKRFEFRTKQVEAKTNLKKIEAMMRIFTVERPDLFNMSECEVSQFTQCYLTRSTPLNGSCHADDPLNFHLPCESHYYYILHIRNTHPGQYVIRAHNKRERSRCDHPSNNRRDLWMLNHCGKFCNIRSYDPVTCDIVPGNCGDIWSC